MKKPETSPPPCYDCADDPGARLEQMFVDMVQKKRIRLGQSPVTRPVFRKPHGVVAARFVVRPDLDPALRIGVFTGSEYTAWLRFSSDAAPTDPDGKTTLGVGVKLFGVSGEKVLGQGDTHDFVLQNHPVFFVDNATDMCEFTYAGVVEGNYQPYLDAHPTTDRILKQMAKVEGSVLTTTYWSVVPFKLGASWAKYVLIPETPAENVPNDAADYLATDLGVRLRQRTYRLRFCVQRFVDEVTTPLDRATVPWDVEPVHVATIEVPRQDPEALGQAAWGENLAYNIWHALPVHAPVGSIAEVRRRVYAASAHTRHSANGLPSEEPRVPRPMPGEGRDATEDTCIVGAVIHPSIGIARVGNSPTEWFYGPEVPDPPAPAPGSVRDAEGRLKRQAARFRVYGVNAQGRIVRELNAANARIRWSAHLANTKAAWFQFQLALDIPEAAEAPPTLLRNAGVADRTQLAIDPGQRTVSGANHPAAAFDTGRFMGKAVYLGELRTDAEGNLVVLGGRGHSASSDGSRAVTFANNDGWHDDVADGPVSAEVEYEGRTLDVTPAWVVVAPPDYAPMRKSVRTMWDLMRDVAISAGTLPRPARPSFNRDIRPIFERLSGLQWVNAGFAAAFGWKGPFDLSAPDTLARLGTPSSADREVRKVLANNFRVQARDGWAAQPWPWLYGDAMAVPAAQTPRQNASLTNTQLAFLQQWALGDFDADYDPAPPVARLEDVPLAERGDTLTRAALEFCLADAFHPGCEMTWPVRTPSMYMAPFRWKHAKKPVEPSFAQPIDPALSLAEGPLGPQYPGGITRWMAVPWQTDTASCRSGYDRSYDPYLPSFWPARVPNQVLTRESYDLVMDETRPLSERLAAFASREAWTRAFDGAGYTESINTFAHHIDWPGIVLPLPGPADRANFPAVIEVEDQSHDPDAAAPAGRRASLGAARKRVDAVERELAEIEKAHRFGPRR